MFQEILHISDTEPEEVPYSSEPQERLVSLEEETATTREESEPQERTVAVEHDHPSSQAWN